MTRNWKSNQSNQNKLEDSQNLLSPRRLCNKLRLTGWVSQADEQWEQRKNYMNKVILPTCVQTVIISLRAR